MSERDILIFAGLLLFGCAFNKAVSYMEKRPEGHNGYTAFLVVIGVAVTVIARIPKWGMNVALDLLLAFVASGTPMILGSVIRHIVQRDRESERIRQLTAEMIERIDG